MYEAFFGLREKPFNLTPDPRFLYLSEKHKEAFAHLLFGIKNRGGFVMVTGEIGTGKTTICRTLLNKLDDDTEVAFIFNPCLSPEELLRTINMDFGIRSKASTVKGLIDELNEYLLERRTKNKNCVLVIDEAQDLEPRVLEQIRLLSNLETETEKLLQIVLIGQPELGANLELPELRQLNQRITARYHLRELNFDETLQYIAYRLRVAGGRRKLRFTRKAVRIVYRFSGGVPRMINAICDRALLVGYTLESRDITARIVRRAAHEVRGERASRKPRRRMAVRLVKAVAAALVVALLAGGAYLGAPMLNKLAVWRTSDSAPPPAKTATKLHAAPPQAPASKKTATTAIAKRAASKPDAAGKYEAMIDALQPGSARDAAAMAILRKWNRKPAKGLPKGDTVADLQRFAADNGLGGVALTPTLSELVAIDLPAFVLIQGKDLEPLWIGIVGKHEHEIKVATGPDQAAWMPFDVIEGRCTCQAVVVWRDPDPSAPLLREGMSGEAVRALQNELSALGRLKRPPNGVFDSATAAAVRRIQTETGLVGDGKVGPLTRMVLASWAPKVPLARLSAEPFQAPIALATVPAHPKSKQTVPAKKPAPRPPISAMAEARPRSEVPKAAQAPKAPVPKRPTPAPPAVAKSAPTSAKAKPVTITKPSKPVATEPAAAPGPKPSARRSADSAEAKADSEGLGPVRPGLDWLPRAGVPYPGLGATGLSASTSAMPIRPILVPVTDEAQKVATASASPP